MAKEFLENVSVDGDLTLSKGAGAGKVLTSDAGGKGSWQDPAVSWQDYTPVWKYNGTPAPAADLAQVELKGRYIVANHTCEFIIVMRIRKSGLGNDWKFTLPVPCAREALVYWVLEHPHLHAFASGVSPMAESIATTAYPVLTTPVMRGSTGFDNLNDPGNQRTVGGHWPFSAATTTQSDYLTIQGTYEIA